MSSIVLDLQNEITKRDCDIVNILRKAHLIAVKLNLIEFDKWISCELNGYTDKDTIPDYREIRGVLKAFNPHHGWVYVMVDEKIEAKLCCGKIPNSISEIKSLCEKSERGLIRELTGETQILLNEFSSGSFATQFRVDLSPAAMEAILEKVKNTVLEWTIRLEEQGILGEGMLFNSQERETAKHIPQAVNNYYGNVNVINAPVSNSPFVAGNNVTMEFTYEKASEITSGIETTLKTENLSTEDKQSAFEMLTEIKDKISQKKKLNVIKALLVGLRDFLIGVGASATVAYIQYKTQGLL